MGEIITWTKIRGRISQHVYFRIRRMRYGSDIKIFKFINKFPYLQLENFQVVRCKINLISHLMGDYLRVPEYLYTFDLQIQCLSQSLHKCFILSHIVCTFIFQVSCDHHSIAMQINKEEANTWSFFVLGTIKVQSPNVWVCQF